MRIAVLGRGVEGAALQKYFEKRGDTIEFFDKFEDSEIPNFHLENFDMVFRSPSVHPQFELDEADRGKSTNWQTMTNYFFEHCKAPIIGVTGTKGKGTTCSMITSILRANGENVHLVGNIGNPSISELDDIKEDDIVVFEMSSFQCWDLKKSPHVSVVLRIEPDHLDRHKDFDDYVHAKSNIVATQSADDYCIFYNNNEYSKLIAAMSKGQKSHYPIENNIDKIQPLLDSLQVPGAHNRENAEAAILAVAAYYHKTLEEFLADETLYHNTLEGLKNFHGLPHRIEFVRELNGVKYYDDNYSSAFPASDVAIAAFENYPTILIAGGKDRHLDLTAMKKRFFSAQNLKKIILIGETKQLLAEGEDPAKYEFAETLKEAVEKAQKLAEKIVENISSNFDLCIPCTPAAKEHKAVNAIVLMSPGAASFDMFKNFGDRGDQYQKIVNKLK